jgi:hypothetical protein
VSGEMAGTANGSARDDLTRIAGLGQDIADRLDEAGIRTYAESADCSAGEIAKVLPSASPLLWDVSTAGATGIRNLRREPRCHRNAAIQG